MIHPLQRTIVQFYVGLSSVKCLKDIYLRSCTASYLADPRQEPFSHDWHINLDDGAEVQAVFIDLQKAFDSVAHARLISQLSNLKYHLTWLLGSPVICAAGSSKLHCKNEGVNFTPKRESAATGRTPNVGVTVTPLQLTPYSGVIFTLIME